MSLYREVRGRRWAALAGVLAVGLAVGAVAGYLGGRASKDEPSLSDQIAELRGDAQSLRLALEQMTIEYRGTVEGGQVASPTEYDASAATAARAEMTLDQLRPDLSALDGAETARLDRAVSALVGLVQQRAAYSAVQARVAEAERALTAVVGQRVGS